MKTAYDAFGTGQGVIVLHEIDIRDGLLEAMAIECLREKAAVIAGFSRRDEFYIGDGERLDFHRLLPSAASVTANVLTQIKGLCQIRFGSSTTSKSYVSRKYKIVAQVMAGLPSRGSPFAISHRFDRSRRVRRLFG
jgi:hypothetical protein